MKKQKHPTVTITSEPPTFTVRWQTLNGIRREFSTKDEEEFQQRVNALHLEYVDSKIHDLEIRVEV